MKLSISKLIQRLKWENVKKIMNCFKFDWRNFSGERFCFYHWPALASHLTTFFIGTLFFSDHNQEKEEILSSFDHKSFFIKSPSHLERKLKTVKNDGEIAVVLSSENGPGCRLNQDRITLIRSEKMVF